MTPLLNILQSLRGFPPPPPPINRSKKNVLLGIVKIRKLKRKAPKNKVPQVNLNSLKARGGFKTLIKKFIDLKKLTRNFYYPKVALLKDPLKTLKPFIEFFPPAKKKI